MVVTKEEIKKGLKALGLKKGDIVMVHSALSSLGTVEGGPEAVIEALLETVGKQGTVVMPYPLGGAEIARIFSLRPDVVRSGHPTHSVSAWGKKAQRLVANHLKTETACGKGTPFAKLIDWGGYILLLGVDQDRNTTLHTIEDYADVPYLSEKKVEFRDEKGEKKTKVLQRFPGPHRNFIGMDRLFRESGAMRVGKIGQAVVRLMKAKKIVEVGLEILKKRPDAFLCDNPNCANCVMQRGKIKAARLKEESFILSAVSDEVAPDIEEAMTILQGEGICHVELRKVGGKGLLEMTGGQIQELKKRLEDKGFAVSSLNTGINRISLTENPVANLDRVRKSLDMAEIFGTRYLIISSFYLPEGKAEDFRQGVIERLREIVVLAEERKVTLLVENEPGTYCAGSGQCEEVIRTINSPCLRLAFNPANFARNGEKPFLGIPSRIRKLSALLYLNDGLFSGSYQLPGYGNAEIKELISILRCRSFGGIFSFKPCLGGGKENFQRSAAAFWHLLDTM